MKKVIFSIVIFIAVVFTILFVFAFNNIEYEEQNIHSDNTIPVLKPYAIVDIDMIIGGVPSGQKIVFSDDYYTFESFDIVNNYVNYLGKIPFKRYRQNVYSDDEGAVSFEGYSTVYINATVSVSGSNYRISIDDYAVSFDVSDMMSMANYILEYQDFMDVNEPSLQKPVEYEVLEDDNVLQVVSKFFTSFGDWVSYLFNRVTFYFNYCKFFIQDYFVNFIF